MVRTPAVTEVEAIVEPDGVADDVGWESVTLISIHEAILAISAVNLAIPPNAITGPFPVTPMHGELGGGDEYRAVGDVPVYNPSHFIKIPPN